MNNKVINLVLIITAMFQFSSCIEETANTYYIFPADPGVWTGQVITNCYVHSINKQLNIHRGNIRDSIYQDSNPDNSQYYGLAGTIKIGKTFDSLSSTEKIYWMPQNGFIVFDLAKHFGGEITSIRTANLKIKLFSQTGYTNDIKFVVSVLDTTILTKSIKERLEMVQNSTGDSGGYLSELTVDIKDKFTPSGKIVIGIKAENADQQFASLKYCKIEFDGDYTRTGTVTASR